MKRVKHQAILFAIAFNFFFVACATTQTIPNWVNEEKETNSEYRFVGIKSNAPTLEEAYNTAINDALGKVVTQVFGGKVTSVVEQFKSEVNGNFNDAFSRQSKFEGTARQVSDLKIPKWEWTQNKNGSYNAFVVLAYSKSAAAAAKAKDAADLLKAKTEFEVGLASVSGFQSKGDARGALQSTLTAYTYGTQISEQNASLALSKSLEVARSVSIVKSENGTVKLLTGQAPIPYAQVLLKKAGATEFTSEMTDAKGELPESKLKNVREVKLDADWLLTVSPSQKEAYAEVTAALKSTSLKFTNKLTNARVLILIEESDMNGLTDRSLVSETLEKKLIEAGYRVVTETQIGKVNYEAIDKALDRDQIAGLKDVVKSKADIAIHGFTKSESVKETSGIKTYASSGKLTVTRLSDGITLASENADGVKGFGDSDKTASIDALKKLGEKLSKSVLNQLSEKE